MTVVVVGAGISGLALVHHLERLGVETVAFEAADRPGGVVRSERVDGRVLDRGPQRTRLTGPVRELVEAAGLAGSIVEAADVPLYVYLDGRLRRVPTTLGAALRTDALSTRGKLRALLEPLAAPPRPGETVRTYLARAFGPEVAAVAGTVYGGLYGTDPEEMYVDRTLGRALETGGVTGSVLLAALRRATARALGRRTPPPAVSFEDGMGALPRSLYERHSGSIRLSTPVRGLERTGEGYRVATDDGAVRADDVVLTVPAGTAAGLLDGVDPTSANALRRLTYNPMAVVTLRADADLRGAGYQVPVEEPLETLGTTWNDSLLGRDGIYTAYLGGGKHPGLVDRSADRLGALAAEEFEDVTGYPATPIDVHRLRPGMPAYDTAWTALDEVDPPSGLHLCTNYVARAGIPGRVREARRLARALSDERGGAYAVDPQETAAQRSGRGPS